MLVYVWSRRNPYIRMNFFGLLNFQAPFLPWVLMGFSLLLGNSIIIDLLGKSKLVGDGNKDTLQPQSSVLIGATGALAASLGSTIPKMLGFLK